MILGAKLVVQVAGFLWHCRLRQTTLCVNVARCEPLYLLLIVSSLCVDNFLDAIRHHWHEFLRLKAETLVLHLAMRRTYSEPSCWLMAKRFAIVDSRVEKRLS